MTIETAMKLYAETPRTAEMKATLDAIAAVLMTAKEVK